MNVTLGTLAVALSLLATAPPAHATGVLPCPGGEDGAVVVVGDDSVTVCVSTAAECAPGEFGTSVYVNGARLARFCHDHPAPGGGGEDPPPPSPDEYVTSLVCPHLATMAGDYGIVTIRYDGDVYVSGEWFWNCPPY